MREIVPDASLDIMFRKARSYNGYLDHPVSERQMRAIWELTKWGPTSANTMPMRIVWVASQDEKTRLSTLVDPLNVDKVLNAPVVAIIGMDINFHDHLPRLFPHADIRAYFLARPHLVEDTAFRNSSLQGGYFIMAARALGLDTGPISGFDNAAVDAAFFSGTSIRSNFISTLGYGDPASIFDRLPRLEFEDACRIV